MKNYDIIIIGGGINSLVAAAYLSKAGKKVVVLEKTDNIGGLASSNYFAPGFKCNSVFDSVPWINRLVFSDLKLEDYGLRFNTKDIALTSLTNNGKILTLTSDVKETCLSIAQFSKSDAEKWPRFCEKIYMLTDFLESLYGIKPPSIPHLDLSGLISMKSMIKPYQKHGREGLVELLRILPMTMLELLDEWFESEPLRGTLSAAGVRNLNQGPMAVGTTFNFLHHHIGNKNICPVRFVSGGTQKIADVIKSIAENSGAKVLTDSEVSKILIRKGTAVGIILSNGEQITSELVASGLNPATTFHLVGHENLNPKFSRRLKNIKFRGATARIHFGLNSLPEFSTLDEKLLKSMVSISPNLMYLEMASNAAKYGQISKEPWIEFTIPSLRENSFAPKGKHVLSATIQYAPYQLREMPLKTARAEMRKRVLIQLEAHAPGLSHLIECEQILMPFDLESKFGLNEGNLNHGEMMLDQFFFMRPTIDTSQYITPINNLFLCGAGVHPGGGLHGTNGLNASKEILKKN